METVGYECDMQTMAMTGTTRHIYFGGAVPMIDVFIDKLDYCHEVNYDGRLELDPWSVSLADILLQKLQIWEINDKDLKDIEYLFTVADFGEDDDKKVNVGYVARRLADDWGFWYTATPTSTGSRTTSTGRRARADQKAKIKQVADDVRARIDPEPKTKGWEKRAKKGTKKIWYNTGLLRLVRRRPAQPRRRYDEGRGARGRQSRPARVEAPGAPALVCAAVRRCDGRARRHTAIPRNGCRRRRGGS